jgi:DNA-binding NarL/FixJ family response regulator
MTPGDDGAAPARPLTVLLADAQQLFVDVVARRLRREPGVGEVHTAVDAETTRAAAGLRPPDVVLLDPDLPGGGGLALVDELVGGTCDTRVVVVADGAVTARVVEALTHGARGWVSKRETVDELVASIRTVHRGEVALPKRSWGPVVLEMATERRLGPQRDRFVGELTQRQRQILALLVRGLSRREIAAELEVSPHTVRSHIQDMLTTVGVHSTPSLVAHARLLRADAAISRS